MNVTAPSGLDPRLLRRAFARFPSGVTAVCGLVDGAPRGLAVSSFTSVSLEPALVSICIDRNSTTWPRLAALPAVGISVLAEQQDTVCRSLAARTGERFATIAWQSAPSGAVFLDDAVLRLECAVSQQVRAGDHDIVVLSVLSVQPGTDANPLVFHGSTYRALAEHR